MKILKTVAPDTGGGKCDFWGHSISYEAACDVRWLGSLRWRYQNVAETRSKATRTVHGRWWRTWGQPAAQQVGAWISESPNVHSADIYSYFSEGHLIIRLISKSFSTLMIILIIMHIYQAVILDIVNFPLAFLKFLFGFILPQIKAI